MALKVAKIEIATILTEIFLTPWKVLLRKLWQRYISLRKTNCFAVCFNGEAISISFNDFEAT